MMSDVFIWLLNGLYLLLVVGTVLVVMLENRQPERTIAWIVAILLLPGVGLCFFYFFGRNIRRQRALPLTKRLQTPHRHKSWLEATETPPTTTDRYQALKSLCDQEFGAPVETLGKTEIFYNGTDFLKHLLEDIKTARSYIYLESYIIEDDKVGRQVGQALKEAAKRGVETRLLYDDVGCWRVPKHFFRDIAHGGVEVEAYMPVHFPSLTHKINYRNHRKICVIDGQQGYIGGMNLAARYLGSNDNVWRDIHLRLGGAAVRRLEQIFLTDWQFVTKGVEYKPKNEPPTTDSHPTLPNTKNNAATANTRVPQVQIVTNDPTTAVPQLMMAYTWAVMHARRYLYVQTPYFMPTEPFLHALKTAAMSGIDVRLMMPHKPDGKLLRRINDSYVAELLAAGVRVLLFEGGFLHSKCLVMDDDWCAVGSANMDFRSFLNNIEVSALIYDHNVSRSVRQQFERDQTQCREIEPSRWAKRSLMRRLRESATRILSPLF